MTSSNLIKIKSILTAAVTVSEISVCLNLPSLNPRHASAFSTCTQTFLKWLPLIFITTYLYHLVMNHPFVDGNKRVGLEAALIFLEINDKSLIANDAELVDLVLKTTAGQIGKREIAEFFRSHCM
jgi:death-on-curing family protein